MSNILTIHPYKINSTWVFDDERTGLKEEAFVLGMSEMISKIIDNKNIKNASDGFDMHFSDQPFDDYDVTVAREYFEDGGNWYSGEIFGKEMRGWLCPALFLYYKDAPQHIYIKAEPLSENVNPIWNSNGKSTRQFFSAT